MTTAVTLHETTKHFSLPGVPSWGREALRNAKPGRLAQTQGLVSVDHVSFSIRQGEIFGLVGPSGSGKTTIIRLIATLLQPDTGEVRVFGYDAVRQPAQVQRLINRVYVEASFFKQLSPLENLLYGIQPYVLAETETLWQAVETLSRLGLERRDIHAPMEGLPRDTLQKVVVARALLSRPRLLLLDEPARGLDPRARYEVWQTVRELRDVHGLTVLVATRDRQEIESLCDRIAMLENGRLVTLEAPLTFDQRATGPRVCQPEMTPLFADRMNNPLVCKENISL